MIGVVKVLIGKHCEPVVLRRQPFVAVLTKLLADTQLFAFEPKMLEARSPTVFASEAKGVNIVLADVVPVFEGDTQLEGTSHRANKVLLLDLQ